MRSLPMHFTDTLAVNCNCLFAVSIAVNKKALASLILWAAFQGAATLLYWTLINSPKMRVEVVLLVVSWVNSKAEVDDANKWTFSADAACALFRLHFLWLLCTHFLCVCYVDYTLAVLMLLFLWFNYHSVSIIFFGHLLHCCSWHCWSSSLLPVLLLPVMRLSFPPDRAAIFCWLQ